MVGTGTGLVFLVAAALLAGTGSVSAASCPLNGVTSVDSSCTCDHGYQRVFLAPQRYYCQPCPAGTYQSADATQAQCTPCAAGTANPATGSATPASCAQCNLGFYSPAGSSSCFACPSGTYSNYARTACVEYTLFSALSAPLLNLDSNGASQNGDLAQFWEFRPNDPNNNHNQMWIFDNTINPALGTHPAQADPTSCGPNSQNCGLWYTVQSIQNNLCYDSDNPANTNGAIAHFWTCDPTSTNQIWIHFNLFHSMTQQVNNAPFCLDNNNAKANGDKPHFWQIQDGNNNQVWKQTECASCVL